MKAYHIKIKLMGYKVSIDLSGSVSFSEVKINKTFDHIVNTTISEKAVF